MKVNVTPEAIKALRELEINQVELVLQRSGCAGPDFVLNDGEFTSRDILLLSSIDGIPLVTDPSNENKCESLTIDWIAGADGGFTVSAVSAGDGRHHGTAGDDGCHQGCHQCRG